MYGRRKEVPLCHTTQPYDSALSTQHLCDARGSVTQQGACVRASTRGAVQPLTAAATLAAAHLRRAP
jgi:hypothetical protein